MSTVMMVAVVVSYPFALWRGEGPGETLVRMVMAACLAELGFRFVRSFLR